MEIRRRTRPRLSAYILEGQPQCHGLDGSCIVCPAHGRLQCFAELKGELRGARKGFRKGYLDEHGCLGPDVLTRSLFIVGVHRVIHSYIYRARILKLVYPCLPVWSLRIFRVGGVRGDMAGLGRFGPLQPHILPRVQNLKLRGDKGTVSASRRQGVRRRCA